MTVEIQTLENGVFQLVKTNDKTGKVTDAEKIQADKVLEPSAIGSVIGQQIKTHGAVRLGWLSFLSLVLASPRLDGFKGTADRATGKVSNEFKAAVRDAESDAVRGLVAANAIKLPVVKGDNDELRLQRFLSTLRDDKNYSNAKVTANKYFALVGHNVVTDGGYIVPVPVMQAAIAAVVDKEPVDKTVAGKLRAIEMFLGDNTLDSDDAVECLVVLNRLLTTVVGVNKHYAEMATAVRSNPDLPVDAAASAALAKAAAPGEYAMAPF